MADAAAEPSAPAGRPVPFVHLPPPTPSQLQALLEQIALRIHGWLHNHRGATDMQENEDGQQTLRLELTPLEKSYTFLYVAGGLIEMSPPKAADLPSWLVATARAEGYALELQAARALVDPVGADPLALETTVDKVIAYVGEFRPIRLEDVDAVVVRTREEVVWDLTNAIGAKDVGKALATLHGTLERGEEGLGAVGLAARHFRQLSRIRSLISAGHTGPELATKAQLHPFVAQKLADQARRVTDDRLEEIFGRLASADRALKSSRLSDRLIVERLVFELCHR